MNQISLSRETEHYKITSEINTDVLIENDFNNAIASIENEVDPVKILSIIEELAGILSIMIKNRQTDQMVLYSSLLPNSDVK